MALGEFQLIERFFSRVGSERTDVMLGVGDDAALVRVAAGMDLVVAADTLVAGIHFPEGLEAELIGHRALAVNLSDMAAMGAEPAWFTLSLTLPSADARWVESFSAGLHSMAKRHGVALIGGDTTRGPLTIAVQILGQLPSGSAVRRSGAQPGDVLCVSGHVGDAAGGLRVLREGAGARQGDDDNTRYLVDRFERPEPRVALGRQLRNLATAAIDVSDGLYADAGHLATASGVALRVDVDSLPLSDALLRRFGEQGARELALGGGDDYELCFTVKPENLDEARRAAQSLDESLHRIGVVEKGQGVTCCVAGRCFVWNLTGYDHFSG